MLTRLFDKTSTLQNAVTGSARLGYLPGLDGMRALAVIAVLLYHGDVDWLPGGFLGVEIFFVISGYLITSLLLSEWEKQGQVGLKNFWMRRARRLLPALFFLIAIVLTYAVVFLPDEVAGLRADALAAFTYSTNWYLIFAQQSYFETMGRPSLLRHLWSLAVEEQFYILFPLFFVLVLSKLRRRYAVLLLGALIVLSAGWMAWLYQPDADPSRVYYGTDTRAAGLLIGAALAFLWMPWKKADGGRRIVGLGLDALAVVALGGLVLACLLINEFDPLLYQGGIVLVSLATAVVIAAVVYPKSLLGNWGLGNPLLRWIGQRSYGIYLWHWFLFMITRPLLDLPLEGLPLLALRLGATFILAELSYHFIEMPVRSGAVGRAWHATLSQPSWFKKALGVFTWTGGVSAVLAVAVLVGYAVVMAQPAAQPEYLKQIEEQAGQTTALQNTTEQNSSAGSADPNVAGVEGNTDPVSSVMGVSSEDSNYAEVSQVSPMDTAETDTTDATVAPPIDNWLLALANLSNNETPAQAAPPSVEEMEKRELKLRDTTQTNAPAPPQATECSTLCETLQDNANFRAALAQKANKSVVKPAAAPVPVFTRDHPAQVVAIGDSVMLGAAPALRQDIADVDVDAELGRQVSKAIAILKERDADNTLPKVVIVHLGNNGAFSNRQFDELMGVLANVKQVIFVNTKVPRAWQNPNNSVLAEGVKRYPNAVLIDWNAMSAEQPDWFWKDGIHLRPEGAHAYADAIASYIQAPNQP